MLRRIGKAAQRGLYTFLNSPLGAMVLLLCAVVLMNSALQLADDALTAGWYYSAFCAPDDVVAGDAAVTGRMDDSVNVAGRSFASELCDEPMDAVYTWVNGSEDQHIWEVAFWQLQQRSEDGGATATVPAPPTVAETTTPLLQSTSPVPTLQAAAQLSQQQLDDQSSRSRFEDHDELRYSLRSLLQYAGWVRNVYIVTNGQVPTWLRLDHPRLRVITHDDLFPDASHLPTFSSPAIESHLHRIPGLSRRFLYLNDDTLFDAPVQPADFFSRVKGHRLYYSWPVPQCADGCPAAWLGDGTCDRQCNVSACDWDAGDCIGPNVKVLGGGSGHAAMPPPVRGIPPKQSNVHCNGNCADGWIGDRYCDSSCNHRDCGYDGLDCGLAPYENDPQFTKFVVELRQQDSEFMQRIAAPASLLSSGDKQSAAVEPPAAAAAAATLPKRSWTIRRSLRFNLGELGPARAFLVNLSQVFPSHVLGNKITSGDHDSPSWVRAASISQLHKVLVVSVVSEWTNFSRTCQFVIEGEREADWESSGTQQLTEDEQRQADLIQTMVHKAASLRARASSSTTAAGGNDPPRASTTRPPTIRTASASIKLIINVTIVNESHSAPMMDASSSTHGSDIRTTTSKSIAVEAAPEQQDTESYSEDPESAPRASHRKLMAALEEQTARSKSWASTIATQGPVLEELLTAEEEASKEEDSSTSSPLTGASPLQRRLMDLFGDSLKHSNMLLTRKFRSTSRKVPAHMVHMIDKQVMGELWNEWPAEWAATSASKFRSRSNLQYAFMHYYWMVHATQELTMQEIFDKLVDVDRSGVMERREGRRVALLLWEKEVPHGRLDELAKGIVQGCEEALAAHAAPVQQDAQSTNASTAAPQLLGESREWSVCRQLMSLPGTTAFQRMLHPPPRTPMPTPYAPSLSEPSGTPPAVATLKSNHNASARSRFAGRNSSAVRRRTNATLLHYTRVEVPAQQHRESPQPEQQPAPVQYRPVSTNPDDKIRPITDAYVATVTWLLRAAAIGVARGGNDVLQPLQWSTNTANDSISNEGAEDPVPLQAETFAASHIAQILHAKYGTVKKYKVTLEELEEVTFVMVRNNVTVVSHQMDHILFKRPKFLCVNDDMNHTSEEYPKIISVVDRMFRTSYPSSSVFELPQGQRHPFTRLPSWYREETRQLLRVARLVDSMTTSVRNSTNRHDSRLQPSVTMAARTLQPDADGAFSSAAFIDSALQLWVELPRRVKQSLKALCSALGAIVLLTVVSRQRRS